MKRYLSILFASCLACAGFAQTYIWKDGELKVILNAGEIRFNKIYAENFTSVTSVNEMIESLYYDMGQNNSYRNRLACAFQGLNTDIEVGHQSTGNKADLYLYSTKKTDTNVSAVNADPWKHLSRIVYNSSIIIEGIASQCDTTKATYSYLLGEALFLRAFALYEMVKMWGDIPFEWAMLGGVQVPYQPKQDRNILYEQMRTDLNRAIIHLPWASQIPNISRNGKYRYPTQTYSVDYIFMEFPGGLANSTCAPSKAAALGMLARVDLTYAGFSVRPNTLGQPSDGYCKQLNVASAQKRQSLYQEALEACAQVINHEPSKLLSSYEQVFKNICQDVTDYSSSEIIWEIPFKAGERGQFLNYNSPKCSNNGALGVLRNTLTQTKNNANVTLPITFYLDFEQGDVRRDVTFFTGQWYAQNASQVISNETYRQAAFPGVGAGEKILYQNVTTASTWYLGKYRFEWMTRQVGLTSDEDGVKFPIIRYADVVLMFCEAALGGITGDVPQNTTGIVPQTQFDLIRTRAGLASKPLNMLNLQEERKFEFAGEYLRKYDLIRWGILKEQMMATRTRIANLQHHTGEYANTSDSVYFKYVSKPSASYTNNGEPCFMIDQISFTCPANFDQNAGWQRKAFFYTESKGAVLGESNYKLFDYDHPEYLESHQLWPIFDADRVYDTNGYLWNDYDY